MSFSVPTVDIGPYVGGVGDVAVGRGAVGRGAVGRGAVGRGAVGRGGVGREQVAWAVDEACSDVGFLQITGHGVPDLAVAGLASAMDDFFGQDLETKTQYRMPPEINRGYSPPRSEALSLSAGVPTSRMKDLFEAFNVGSTLWSYPGVALNVSEYPPNVWPSVPDFRSRVETYYAHAARVARTLTEIFADALGLAPRWFDRLTGHSIEMLRMNNYALPPGPREPDNGAPLVGMGAHTDFGIVTVLWADQVAGLQILAADGRWHDVEPADGALLVNLGDLTARLTNERWMSTMHRVLPPVVDGSVRRRRSAAFFLDGNAGAVIAPVAPCVGTGEPLYEPITVREHIAAKLRGSRALDNNSLAEREAARIRSALG